MLSALTAALPELRVTVLGGRKLTASPWHRGDFRGTPIISSVLWTLHELPAEVTVSGPTSARAALRSRVSRLRAPGVSAFAVTNKEQSQPLCLGSLRDVANRGTAWDTVPLIPSSTSTFTWGLFPLRWIPDEGVDAEGCFND